jgi:hypothetical protein
VLVAAVCGFALACGGGGGSGDDDADLDPDAGDDVGDDGGPGGEDAPFPVGLAVASPLSRGDSGMGPAPTARQSGGMQVLPLINVTPGKSFSEKQAELAALLSGTTAEDCALVLPHQMGGYSPLCYGPSLDYEDHPDGTGTGQLPSGDLGIWEATQGESEPCAAAKLSSLINNVGDKVDYGLYMAASMVCLMNVNGVAMPAEGASQDLTALVDGSVSANNPGFTVHEASVARLADDASGDAVYAYSVNIDVLETISPTDEYTVTLDTVLEHVFDAASPGSYHGAMRGTIGAFGMRDPEAYSVAYERTGEYLRYGLLLASYPADAEGLFDDAGKIDIAGDWTGNLNQGVFDLDAETGTFGNVSFAWQAGRGDSHTRVFNVFVEGGEASVSGCGFFGFGPRFDADTGTASYNSISTFICNWAGPGNQHTGLVGSAQKQCFASEAGGPLAVTENHIAYAPVNDCDTTDDPEDADFTYKVLDSDDWLVAPIANELIDLSTDPDYPTYSVPTPPTGF